MKWQSIKEGNTAELKALYLQLLPKVEYWILQNQGTRQDAMDVFQDALASIIKGADRQQEPDNIEGFIFQICKFKWIDILRKQKKEEKYKTEVISEMKDRHGFETSTLNKIIDIERESIKHTMLEESFQKISALCQQLLAMIRSGTKAAEICEVMSFNQVSTVHRRKFACMESWRKEIKDHRLYKQSV